eukprot:9115831-Pyramimonas_sp.AAC.1
MDEHDDALPRSGDPPHVSATLKQQSCNFELGVGHRRTVLTPSVLSWRLRVNPRRLNQTLDARTRAGACDERVPI